VCRQGFFWDGRSWFVPFFYVIRFLYETGFSFKIYLYAIAVVLFPLPFTVLPSFSLFDR